MSVRRAAEPSAALAALWDRALHDVRAKRGGEALVATICEGLDAAATLMRLIDTSSLWTFEDEGALKGFAVVRRGIVQAVYVANRWRRQGVATALVTEILANDDPPVDAYALPGDRATKSLYESLGWKARLLTMRGA